MDEFFDRKLNEFSQSFEKKITESVQNNMINPLSKRVELLENSNKLKDEKIDTLTAIVTNQQKSLSRLDSSERNKHIIINGLSEDIIDVNGEVFEDDDKKLSNILKLIGVNKDPSHVYTMNRIGKVDETGTIRPKRTLKVTVGNKEHQDEIKEKAKGLNVQVEHQVQFEEEKRLRKKMSGLKKLLLVDGEVKDKNTFFL